MSKKSFTHLHTHSHYSLLDGLPKIDELVKRAKELGMDSLALTDHGVLYGAVEFYKKAKKAGIKPIIGAELYLAKGSMYGRQPGIDDKRYHIGLLVRNETGYKNLVKLISKAHLEGFYYKPRIDEELLFELSDGLIALSGCLQGKIARLVSSGKMKEAVKTAEKYEEVFGKGHFYLEIQNHPNIPKQDEVNKKVIKVAEKTGIPLVATEDMHYLEPDDAEAQDILMLINTGADREDKERLTMKTDDFSMKSPEEMAEKFKDHPEALENTGKIAEMCNFDFDLDKTRLPDFKTPNGETPEEYLEELCKKGLKEKKDLIEDMNEAKERLDYELSVIKEMGFSTYFLIVQDFVNWAKDKRIVVGPGRGSAGGSIVSYLLGITDIDPLKHELLFERFLNPDRISMPDIDIDFTDRRRDEVIEYVADKYGSDHVAQIITFGTMAARASIRDVGRAMGLSYGYCDKVAKMIPFGNSLNEALKNVSELKQLYDTDNDARELIDFAKKLEGCARHASTHACGVVISDEPLDEIVPRQHPTQDDDAIVTQYEMHAVEDLGLLKMDFLGLKNLTIIEDTLSRVYVIRDKSIDISEIPFNDRKTYKLFQKGDTTGVFQLESAGMKRYLKELRPTKFEDIVTMIALYRPGPMQFIPEYIQRKHGRKDVRYIHPDLKPILKDTYGVCIFQEQLMRIAQDLAGFSLSEADVLRKAVGKKIKKLLVEQKEKFINGAIENGIEKETATELWEWILPFARYGFNKSHSVAYGMIAYQTAYLKAHYPVEFMSSLLTADRSDTDKISFLIEECENMGIEVLPPDINESFRNFSVVPGEDKIRFGLLAIKNVGSNVVEAIIDERKENGKFESFSDFVSRIKSKDFNKKSLEALIKAGAFDNQEERNRLLSNIETILAFNREVKKIESSNQGSLFENSSTDSKPGLRLADFEPAKLDVMLKWEKELLGLYVSGHPLDKYKKMLEKRATPIKELEEKIANQRIKVGGIISSIKKILTKKGEPMLFVELEDLSDRCEVIVFPRILEKNQENLEENKIVFVNGKVDNWKDRQKIIAEEIEEIIEK